MRLSYELPHQRASREGPRCFKCMDGVQKLFLVLGKKKAPDAQPLGCLECKYIARNITFHSQRLGGP